MATTNAPTGPDGLPLLATELARTRAVRNFRAPVESTLDEAGRMARFMLSAVIEIPKAWRYGAEVLRQAALLLLGSSIVLLSLQFVIGLQCGTEGNYVLRGFGASVYTGAFSALCGLREAGPFMFGFIASAKIGAGLAAELGTMRINEEIDAMEAQGISSIRYIVTTRLLAAWLVIPFWFFVGMALNFLGEYFVIIVQIGEVSLGGWGSVHWAFITPYDLAVGLLKFYTMGTFVVLIGMYYGYYASGGPVGVGTATARSMSLNLIQVMGVNALLTLVAWGFDPKIPIGG
ncbi:ABC transporter permease [Conexibacter sp. W3-3-2]|jgi:phospholipid/cholesterol/gamma-HCH transport system permease protein|uniref:MlaE family ABC transporter permease n=1 Tax=Conexibacter sp. W3-3-2 TaxID=2675227 RepID=UPI001E32A080|nr:ABC transporter permease [Conexibacter sp. W3-3-2]